MKKLYCLWICLIFCISGCTTTSSMQTKPKPAATKATYSAAQTASPEKHNAPKEFTYIGNKSTKKFHKPECSSILQMSESNKAYMTCTRERAIEKGYTPCKKCNP